MEPVSLEKRLSRRIAGLTFLFGILLSVTLLTLMYKSLERQFLANRAAWLQSLPGTLLPHLIDSEHFSVKSKLGLVESTHLFSYVGVFDAGGQKIAEFGDAKNPEKSGVKIADYSGTSWGSFAYTSNYSMLREGVVRGGTILLLIVLGLTFGMYFWAKSLLSRELNRFNTFLERVQALASSIRGKSDVKALIANMPSFELTTPEVRLDTLEQKRIRQVINEFTEELAGYARRVQDSQTKLIDSEKRYSKSQAIVQTTQMLAHDVRRPFRTLQSGLEVLAITPVDNIPKLIGQLSSDVRETLSYVNGLVQDVMEINRETTSEKTQVNLSALVQRAIGEIFPAGATQDVQLAVNIPDNLKMVANEIKLHRVFVNILDNARSAVNAGGRIEVSVRGDVKAINIDIFNTGSSIPEADWEKVFDIFYTKGKSQGTGLGLAIVKKVATDHNGEVRCFSDKRGTTFSLIFLDPLSGVSELSVAKKFAVETKSGTGIKNIVVDDNIYFQEALRHHLDSSDNLVIGSPEEFFDIYAKTPELLANLQSVITDIDFGSKSKSDGFSLAKFIKENLPHVRVMSVSDRPDFTPDEGEAFDGHVEKTIESVAAALERKN